MSRPSERYAGGSAGSSSSPPVSVQELVIRAPKELNKKYNVMRFTGTQNVDFTQWRSVKMERENNLKAFKGQEELPKFGAGSEFNHEVREEARRKRYGIQAKKYRPEEQPWILEEGGKKDGKKFRGVREGGVGDNSAYYVFVQAPDGAIEAYPLHEWYNFQPIQRYKALTAEEAEEEFGKRKKALNYFSLMLQKRLKGDDDIEEDQEEEEGKKSGGSKAKMLKISDMDEWIDSDDDMSSSDEEEKPKVEDSDEEVDKKPKKKVLAESKKRKRDVDEEALEESDDGDDEGRELDYISDSSESESEPESKASNELKSVAEEDALRKLLTSDEDSEDEEKKSEEEDVSEKEEEKKCKSSKDNEDNHSKKKKKNKKKKKSDYVKKDSSSSSSDSDTDPDAYNISSKQSFGSNLSTANNSQSASSSTPLQNGMKRKLAGSEVPSADLNNNMSAPAKKIKLDSAMALSPTFSGNSNSSDYGITEKTVRRYLKRKPMTTTELLAKFKRKTIGVSSEKLIATMTAVLKKINPVKQTIEGKMYLSI
ncbi:general transcription factor IIF subunit 1-like [Sabethes cyaneus]|uniref:general transcription factor IIF subunit 1-like n=1 Tax=Sabethes cyaneus TaxID=53552 RepID=UPI00237DF6BE|nr:general transcription factor IIF subunit 1-like [Sabethes cyaneus]